VGESADPRTVRDVRCIAEADAAVARFVRALTMHLGPNDVLLTLGLQFRPDLSGAEAARAIDRLDRRISEQHPEVWHTFVEAQAIATPGAPEAPAHMCFPE